MSSASPSPDPKPPDGTAVFRRFMRRRGAGRAFGAGYGARSDAIREQRERLASNNAWRRWTDRNGVPIDPDDVLGAMDMMGERRWEDADMLGGGKSADDVFRDIASIDPDYQIISLDYQDDSPWGSTTYTSSAGDFFASRSDEYLNRDATGMLDERGYGYAVNPSGDPNKGRAPTVTEISSVGKWPADITVSPTSTTNPGRPRTVAAGYDGKRRVLTVVFRDATLYNFYGVNNLEWGAFLRSQSKGKHIRLFLDSKVRGAAEVGAVPAAHREMLYKVARTAQVLARGKQTVGKARQKKL